MDDLDSLARDIREAACVVALTGSGISAPSGVPTFRGADGVWDHFDEGQFTYGRFQRDPAGFWRDRLELQRALFGSSYRPNVAHEALARLGRTGPLEAIITQNTDGLHDRAANVQNDVNRSVDNDCDREYSEDGGRTNQTEPAESGETEPTDPQNASGASILELHGNAHRVVCVDCGSRTPAEPVLDRVDDGDVPPRCDCGGLYKPDVVLFGQQLSKPTLQRARSLARESDVFLAIGSSLVVEPAASLPRVAARSGATVAVVNLEETPVDRHASTVYRADVTEILPRLADLVESV
ncbi:NAD-dependent protein deacetylase [Halobacteria archaeon AArc-curdl1]|uniref:NAD-dependent protein deacetylase n=1 Tax=Natronosalvus hydrolyticus TaxID=2979988 RepID=A0AAP2Z4Y4_9EURY|nr:NAD-dependent protein deacetylase [Halobacteria archaeon AArc-curdl1]